MAKTGRPGDRLLPGRDHLFLCVWIPHPGFSQHRTGHTHERHSICVEHTLIFFLSLFAKQCDTTTICTHLHCVRCHMWHRDGLMCVYGSRVHRLYADAPLLYTWGMRVCGFWYPWALEPTGIPRDNCVYPDDTESCFQMTKARLLLSSLAHTCGEALGRALRQ